MTRRSSAKNHFLARILAVRRNPFVIAHRGDSFHAPENTLEALEMGHARGADACEIDVRLSRDGVAVIIHDESLLRTTNVANQFAGDPRVNSGSSVQSFDLQELRSLDAGSWFLDDPPRYRGASYFRTNEQISSEQRLRYRSGEVRLPDLIEVLQLVAHLDWLANVEIKVDPGTSPRKLLNVVLGDVQRSDTSDRILISSFDHDAVKWAAECDLPIATGLLTPALIPDIGRYVSEILGADLIHTAVEGIGQPMRIGVPVMVYTVNDVTPGGVADRLAAWPVDGMFTDDPGGLRERFGLLTSFG